MNKTIKLSLPHDLSAEEAKSRIQTGLTDMRRQHAAHLSGVRETWTGNRLDFQVQSMGQNITGRVDVLAKEVRIEVDLPWILAMIASKFSRQIETEGRRMLEHKPPAK